MEKDRLAAFTDGVVAVIITIMVLDLKAPHEDGLAALSGLVPLFLGYVLSFTYVAIYWNNHHHLFGLVRAGRRGDPLGQPAFSILVVADPLRDRDGSAIITTLRFPRPSTAWRCLMPAVAWLVLQRCIIRSQGAGSVLARGPRARRQRQGFGRPFMVRASSWRSCYPPLADAIYALVALLWLVPDRRYEAAMQARRRRAHPKVTECCSKGADPACDRA